MSEAHSRIPVTLLTGFLGAGKTSLLQRFLHRADLRRTAVIINEMGEIGLDHDLIEVARESVVAIEGGCFCCTTRTDLSRALRQLNLQRIKRQIPDFDRVVIETSGIADPVPVLQTLISDPICAQEFALDAIVTVVDGLLAEVTLDHHEQARRQIAVADRLLVTKLDLTASGTAEKLSAALRAINPTAPILAAPRTGLLDPDWLKGGSWSVGRRLTDAETWLNGEAPPDHGHDHDGHDRHHHGDVASFSLRRPGAIPRRALEGFLKLLALDHGQHLLRMKGLVRLQESPDRPALVHAVQHVVHEPMILDRWPSADQETRLVIIGQNLPQERVQEIWASIATG